MTSRVLVDILSNNSIHCFSCKNKIDPEVLGLDNTSVDEIAHWFRSLQALYAIWLHSGEYEQYAKKKMLDKNGQINVEGMRIAKKLSEYCPAYYWWFCDTDDGGPSQRPNCNADLDLNVEQGIGKCEPCSVSV